MQRCLGPKPAEEIPPYPTEPLPDEGPPPPNHPPPNIDEGVWEHFGRQIDPKFPAVIVSEIVSVVVYGVKSARAKGAHLLQGCRVTRLQSCRVQGYRVAGLHVMVARVVALHVIVARVVALLVALLLRLVNGPRTTT